MKKNVEVLKELGILGDVRERIGLHPKDASLDEAINKMTPDRIVEEWCGWEIGDTIWWTELKTIFDELTKNQQDE